MRNAPPNFAEIQADHGDCPLFWAFWQENLKAAVHQAALQKRNVGGVQQGLSAADLDPVSDKERCCTGENSQHPVLSNYSMEIDHGTEF